MLDSRSKKDQTIAASLFVSFLRFWFSCFLILAVTARRFRNLDEALVSLLKNLTRHVVDAFWKDPSQLCASRSSITSSLAPPPELHVDVPRSFYWLVNACGEKERSGVRSRGGKMRSTTCNASTSLVVSRCEIQGDFPLLLQTPPGAPLRR